MSACLPRPARTSYLGAAAFAAIAASSLVQELPRQTPIPGADRWEIVINNPRFDRDSDAKVAPYLGRDDAIWLRANTHVVSTGPEFSSGTIEFDVVPMERSDFVAVMFRRTAYNVQENIYFRPPKSGSFDALQYAPRLHGSTWQLYGDFNRATEWPRDAWTRVRIEVTGPSMRVFVNDAVEPVLEVPRLRGEPVAGAVGFWARVNFENDVWAGAISNVRIRHDESTPPLVAEPQLDPAMINDWQVSDAFQVDHPTSLRTLPEVRGWRSVGAEEAGLVNVMPVVGRPAANGKPWTVLARTTISSSTARTAVLNVGYSDDVTVFLNGEPLYAGRNGWESRYPRFLGLVRLDQEHVYLPLRSGENDLVLAVSDDLRFGWGFKARLEPGP